MGMMTQEIKTAAIAAIETLSGCTVDATMAEETMTHPDRYAEEMGITLEILTDELRVARDLDEDGQTFDFYLYTHVSGASLAVPVLR